MQLFMKTSVVSNKPREKHVLGTASTAGSLCFFDLSSVNELQAALEDLQSLNQKLFNTFGTVCLCSIGTPKLL